MTNNELNYALFAACRSEEKTSEDTTGYGLLTQYFCEVLEETEKNELPGMTCRDVYLAMQQKIANTSGLYNRMKLVRQMSELGEEIIIPEMQVLGNIDWQIFGFKPIFGENYLLSEYFFDDQGNSQLKLFAGYLHGIEENFAVGIYNIKDKELKTDNLKAIAKVSFTTPVESTLKPCNTNDLKSSRPTLYKAKLIADKEKTSNRPMIITKRTQNEDRYMAVKNAVDELVNLGNQSDYRILINDFDLVLQERKTSTLIVQNTAKHFNWFFHNIKCVLWEDHLKNCVKRVLNEIQSDKEMLMIQECSFIEHDKILVYFVETNFQRRRQKLVHETKIIVPSDQQFYFEIQNNFTQNVYVTVIEFDCNKQVTVIVPNKAETLTQEAILPAKQQLVSINEKYLNTKESKHVRGQFSIPKNAITQANGDAEEMIRFIFTSRPVDFSYVSSSGINFNEPILQDFATEHLLHGTTRGNGELHFAVMDVTFQITKINNDISFKESISLANKVDNTEEIKENHSKQGSEFIKINKLLQTETNVSHLLTKISDIDQKVISSNTLKCSQLPSKIVNELNSIDDLKSRAREEYNKKNYSTALEIYDQAISVASSNASLYHNRSLTHYKLGDKIKAYNDVVEATNIDKKFHAAWYFRAQLADGSQKFEDALNCVQTAYSLKHNDSKTIKLLQKLASKLLDNLTQQENVVEDNTMTEFWIVKCFQDFDKVAENQLHQRVKDGLTIWIALKPVYEIAINRNENEATDFLKTVVFFLMRLGIIYNKINRADIAVPIFMLALTHATTYTQKDVSFCCHFIAVCYTHVMNFKYASIWIKRALEEAKKLNVTEALLSHYAVYVNIYCLKGKYEKAVNCGLKAKALAKKNECWGELSQILLHLGATNFHLGKIDDAVRDTKESVKFFEQLGDNENAADGYLRLSMYGKGQSDDTNSLDYLNKSAELLPRKSHLVQVNQARANIYFNRALLYLQENNKDSAIKVKEIGERYFADAVNSIQEMPEFMQAADLSAHAMILSDLCLKLNEFDKVESVSRSILKFNLVTEITALFKQNLGMALFAQNRFDEALLEIQATETLVNSVEQTLKSDQNFITWRHKPTINIISTLLQWLYLCKNQNYNALAAADKYRARAMYLNRIMRNPEIQSNKYDGNYVENLLRNLNTVVVYLSYYSEAQLVACWIFNSSNDTLTAVGDSSLKMYLFDLINISVSIDTITLMNNETSSSEISRSILNRTKLMANTDLNLTNEKHLQNFDNVNATEFLSKLITRSAFEKIKSDKLTNDHERKNDDFKQLLYLAIRANLHGECCDSRILVVPDGSLWTTSFATLADKNTDTPLIKQCIISFTPSLSIKTHSLNISNRNSSKYLIIGGPHLSQIAKERFLCDLPASLEECKLIELLMQKIDAENTIVLTGDCAIGEVVYEMLETCCIFHAACHAISIPNETVPDALVLYADKTCSESFNNGLLTASLIQNLNLSGLELAFLNCCYESKVYSEGLVGLARSFLFAGAKAVVLSTTSVQDDVNTCKFVEKFYEFYFSSNVNTSRDAAASLCYAQRWSFDNKLDKKYWAAYIVLM